MGNIGSISAGVPNVKIHLKMILASDPLLAVTWKRGKTINCCRSRTLHQSLQDAYAYDAIDDHMG